MNVIEAFVYTMAFCIVFFVVGVVYTADNTWYAEAVKSENQMKIAKEKEKTERQRIASESFSKNLPTFTMIGVILLAGVLVAGAIYSNNKITTQVLANSQQQPPNNQQNYTALPNAPNPYGVQDTTLPTINQEELTALVTSGQYSIEPFGNGGYTVTQINTGTTKSVVVIDTSHQIEAKYEWS